MVTKSVTNFPKKYECTPSAFIFFGVDTNMNILSQGSDIMAELDVKVLAADNQRNIPDLTFAKISEFEQIETVSPTDFLLVSGFRNGEEITQRIRISDIKEHFDESFLSIAAQWFAPRLDAQTSTIHWDFCTIADTGNQEGDTTAVHPVYPIDLIAAIGDVSDTKSGLLPPSYKAVLDTLGPVTTEHNGLMTVADKSKLDNIEANANNYVLPTASTSTLGGVKVDGTTITINNGVIRANSGAPEAVRISIGISDWDIQTHTVKVNTPIDTNKLNTINVDANSLDEWINCRVHAILEDSTGITFACQNVPSSTLSALVLSTAVNIV